MTVPRLDRCWRFLPLGLLVAAGLLGSGGAAGAVPKAASVAPQPKLTWSTVSPPTAPPPLAYASAVYDSDDKTVVVFGGVESNGTLSNDTWVWNGSTWTDYAGSVVQAPAARELAAMAFDPKLHQLILFGGEGADGQLLHDTWAWNGASWYQESGPPVSHAPSAREGAAMAYDGSGDLVLFGGAGVAGSRPGGTVNPTTSTSTTAAAPPVAASASSTPGPVSNQAPPPVTGANPSGGPSQVVRSAQADASPTDSSPATPTSVSAGLPSAAATAGGSNVNGASSAASSADPGTDSSATAAGSPASSFSLSDNRALPGATEGALTALNDTWVWTSNGWAATGATGPPARVGADLALDQPANMTVLFGGSSVPSGAPSTGLLNDTWGWTGQNWTRLAPASSPAARQQAVMAPDPSAGGVVLFGGSAGTPALGDTWVWTGGNWAAAHPAHSPAPRAGAAAAFDSASRQLVVFGGIAVNGAILGDTVILTTSAPLALGPGVLSTPSAGGNGSSGTINSSTPPRSGSSTSTNSGLPGQAGLAPARGPLSILHALHRGDLVTLSGQGFAPGTTVTLTFHSNTTVVGRALTNGLGDFSATVAIPDSASAGTHHFDASGRGRRGSVSELIATVKIVGVSGLDTTSTMQRVVLTAVALLIPAATWLVLLATGRVRRRPRVPA